MNIVNILSSLYICSHKSSRDNGGFLRSCSTSLYSWLALEDLFRAGRPVILYHQPENEVIIYVYSNELIYII